MSRESTSRVVSKTRPQATPKQSSQSVTGSAGGTSEQLAIDFVQANTIAHHIEDLYRVFQGLVEEFGGVVALAASMEKPVPGVGLRVRHAPDSKGEIQKATLDMLGHVVADPNCRLRLLSALSAMWGFKVPIPRHEPTLEQKYRLLLAGTSKSDLERAADAGGFDVEAFRR